MHSSAAVMLAHQRFVRRLSPSCRVRWALHFSSAAAVVPQSPPARFSLKRLRQRFQRGLPIAIQSFLDNRHERRTRGSPFHRDAAIAKRIKASLSQLDGAALDHSVSCGVTSSGLPFIVFVLHELEGSRGRLAAPFQARADVLEYVFERLGDLGVYARAALVCAFVEVGLREGGRHISPPYAEAVARVFLATDDCARLTSLKDAIDIATGTGEDWRPAAGIAADGVAADGVVGGGDGDGGGSGLGYAASVASRFAGAVQRIRVTSPYFGNLYELMYARLSPAVRTPVLQHFAVQGRLVSNSSSSSSSASAQSKPRVVITDVDDTLVAGWVDTSVPAGTVIPGAAQFLLEIMDARCINPVTAAAEERESGPRFFPGWWTAYRYYGATPAAPAVDASAAPAIMCNTMSYSEGSDVVTTIPTSAAAVSAAATPPARPYRVPSTLFVVSARPGGAGGAVSRRTAAVVSAALQLHQQQRGGDAHSSPVAAAASLRERSTGTTVASDGEQFAPLDAAAAHAQLPGEIFKFAPVEAADVAAVRTRTRMHHPPQVALPDASISPSIGINDLGRSSSGMIIEDTALAAADSVYNTTPSISTKSSSSSSSSSSNTLAAAAAAAAASASCPPICVLLSPALSTSTLGIVSRKTDRVLSLMSLWPEADVVLVGDSGQGDAAVMASAIRLSSPSPLSSLSPSPCPSPRHVFGFVHDVTPLSLVTGDGGSKTVYKAMGGLAFFRTYVSAATAAWQQRIISHAAAVRVADAAYRAVLAPVQTDAAADASAGVINGNSTESSLSSTASAADASASSSHTTLRDSAAASVAAPSEPATGGQSRLLKLKFRGMHGSFLSALRGHNTTAAPQAVAAPAPPSVSQAPHAELSHGGSINADDMAARLRSDLTEFIALSPAAEYTRLHALWPLVSQPL